MELSGLEPLTSCMPWNTLSYTAVRTSSPGLDSDLLFRSPETTAVQTGSPRTVTSLVTSMTPSPSGSNTVSLSGISRPADARARITGPLEYGSGGPGGVLTWACKLTRPPLNPGELQLRAAALPTRGAWNAPASPG